MSSTLESEVFKEEFDRAYEIADIMRSQFVRHVEMPQEQTEIVLGAVLQNASVLLEGPPGVGKTLIAKTLGRMIGGSYGRIQGTPDTQPTDVIGVRIYNPLTREFEFEKGPVFNQILHVDEINRSSPRANAALLQAMGEKIVTVNDTTYPTGNIVTIATQNPHEIASGTYPLNAAQKDRFTAGIILPDLTDEQVIRIADKDPNDAPKQVISIEELRVAKGDIKRSIAIPSEVKTLGAAIRTEVSRSNDIDKDTSFLGGARPYMDMVSLARIIALFRRGRTVSADDMRLAAMYALPHRIELSTQASIKGDKTAIDIVNTIAKNAK